ncbi:MAG: hypothetical protein J6N19_03830 [Clostridium sp.]|nr:hypothetical protein [Clostridium sp.]
MILRMMPGGDTIDYDALTATAADVPEGLTFIGEGSEEEQAGTLENRENMHGAPGFSPSWPDVPVHQSVRVIATTDTNGDKQIAVAPPRGKYPGNWNAYVGIYPAEIGIEPEVIANGEKVGGVTGTFGNDSTATGADVRDGKVYYDKNGRQIGSAGDYAAAAATLKCGEVYNIQKGFHQAGKVTAASLSSQTQPKEGDAAAAAAQILEGYGAWVNGAYRDGSMPDKGNVAASDSKADDDSSTLRFTIPETGRYTKGNYLSRTYAQIRTALGIVASVIKNGTTIAGLKGTYGSDATAAADQILKGKTAYGKDGKITGTLNLTAANIRKGVSYAGVTGTWYGNKKCISAMAVYGNTSTAEEHQGEAEFKMPEDGVVYYGGFSFANNAYGKCTVQILKNGTVMDNRDLNNDWYYRGTMWDKSFTVKKNDTVKVKCTATSGTICCGIQAVIVY